MNLETSQTIRFIIADPITVTQDLSVTATHSNSVVTVFNNNDKIKRSLIRDLYWLLVKVLRPTVSLALAATSSDVDCLPRGPNLSEGGQVPDFS